MRTKLYTERKIIPTVDWGELNPLPPISFDIELASIENEILLDEDDGLFINYGQVNSVYPYRYQDGYGRDLSPAAYETVVLENDFLKATFMPCFGGKLWSLFDKKANRELLFENSAVRPGNLSTRKAWLSGGIEWNGGFKGHGPYTCAPVHTSMTQLNDGTPVLRFYYFERIRKAVVQMDMFLPSDSKLLYVRVRLTNPNSEVIPMYWWSNIAVEEKDGDRVVTPATQAYTQFDGKVTKIPVPNFNGIDVTYPANNVTAIDYFWKTEFEAPKYIFQGDRSGYGLYQTSTAMLKGRKLFVWGNTQGGRKWMNFLTADESSGRYDEIQCGLAYTQYESLPMPPRTVWEWVEGYGALQVDPKKLHGAWEDARRETESAIAREMLGVDLEKLLVRTRPMAKSRAQKVVSYGDGWGALELKEIGRGVGGLMCAHLDFGETDEEQRAWERLLAEGSLGEHDPQAVPRSYCSGDNWKKRLDAALKGKDRNNWYAWFQAGVLAFTEKRWQDAEMLLQCSCRLTPNLWANYALAILYRKQGLQEKELTHMLSAYEFGKQNVFLAKELFLTLHVANRSEEIKELYENAVPEIRENNRCALYYAFALARLGETDAAEQILCGDKPLIVQDMRECETSTVELWNYIRERKGLPPSDPPSELDFRMFAEQAKWINKQESSRSS